MRLSWLRALLAACVLSTAGTAVFAQGKAPPRIQSYALPAGAHPHDVAPAPDGGVWYTAQTIGELGRLDPATGKTTHFPLGAGAAPHGVIVGPDGAAWVTDGGQNAILRVDPVTHAVKRFPLPAGQANANLNTAVFDARGRLWFTGQNGVYGELDPASGRMRVFDAPQGRGPYGIAVTPGGDVYFASLAGGYIARIDTATGAAHVMAPPTPRSGPRRIWSDSKGTLWISEWTAGKLGAYDPGTGRWREWALPGESPHAYAMYVDEQDKVWLSDWGKNAVLRFDPQTEKFETFVSPRPNANVRQMLGRPGEAWAAESGTDHLVVYRFGAGGPR
ncbi:Virginiamycin B lyase [Cupriavidus laharis]|uniref:Virginiamycin B lyase n=1 Tax=Cupriavidus laharis TaxID=151654 RepID=A0ABM8WSC2_9BURK|nr:lyase [Cupriavidus laharis]CAG9170363.1 Virginiamycin B lyase [Cupriavidus laharis]